MLEDFVRTIWPIKLVYVVAITTKCHQLLESMPLRGKAFCCHINRTIQKIQIVSFILSSLNQNELRFSECYAFCE